MDEVHTPLEKRDTVIKLTDVSKTFFVNKSKDSSLKRRIFNPFSSEIRRQSLQALDGVSLEIKRGEFFGILGRNGSGKSTLLKIMTGAMLPDKGGKVETKGRVIRLALAMGFDPNLSARENIYVNSSIIGLTFKEIGERFDAIVGFAELEKFIDTPIKYYSSGMRSRLAFAIALNANADIFLMDEFFGGVGDIAFKKKSEEVFQQTFLDGRTIVHVSHSLKTIEKYCDRVLLLDNGQPLAVGPTQEVLQQYKDLFNKKGILINKRS